MKKVICFVIFALLFCGDVPVVKGSKLEIGSKFDVKRLGSVRNGADSTIIAFMPSLTYDCEYASMLTQSFYYYFDRKMAFGPMDKTPNVRVFLVVRDGRNEAKSTQNIIGRMNVVYDEKGEVFSHFGVEAPYGKNDNSTVVLLDSNEKIALVDTAYRAQGEHLKPLESKLKALNGIDATVSTAPASKPLKVGDIAPNFLVHGGQTLRDLRGKVVLVSFYPAAFSGSFPKPYDVAPAEAGKRASEQTASTPAGISAAPLPQGVTKTASGSYIIDGRSVDMKSLISCSYQILELDKQPADPIKTAKRILVSSSTPPLLEQWRSALNTSNIIYANDPDYWISKQYLSYNPAGYNNRVSVIVDQTGKIAYIDDSFDTPDEPVIEGKIKELLDKDKKHSGR